MQAGFGRGLGAGSPAVYRIVVQGRLDLRLSERLAGMGIVNRIDEDGAPESVLSGRLTDQAQLSGVMNTLYELHRPILRVEIVEAG